MQIQEIDGNTQVSIDNYYLNNTEEGLVLYQTDNSWGLPDYVFPKLNNSLRMMFTHGSSPLLVIVPLVSRMVFGPSIL